MKARITAIVEKARNGGRRLSVYHELTPDLYSATSKTFVGTVYAALGLRNIADAADDVGTGYPQLSSEYVVAESPDLIVLADTVCCGQKPSTVASRPGWDRISAVRTGSIVLVDDSIASRWGPRLVNFFRALSSALARLQR
jgi:iron complex transport system substrate-binding protein